MASTKAFTSQVTVLALLALLMGRIRMLSSNRGRQILQALEEVPYHHQQKDRDRYTQVKKNSTSEASMNLTKKVAQDLEDACPLQVFIAIFSSILSGTPHLFNTPLTHLCLSIAGITGDDTTICVGAGNSQKRSI